MTEKPPRPKPPKAREKGARTDRLAAALRANLARRKAQKRARSGPGQGGEDQG